MTFMGKLIQCSNCGTTFTFTAEEKELFQSWGYTSEPKRCSSCRQERRSERYGNGNQSQDTRRQMFRATCTNCGKDTEVPFRPRADRPAYCSVCYLKVSAMVDRCVVAIAVA